MFGRIITIDIREGARIVTGRTLDHEICRSLEGQAERGFLLQGEVTKVRKRWVSGEERGCDRPWVRNVLGRRC